MICYNSADNLQFLFIKFSSFVCVTTVIVVHFVKQMYTCACVHKVENNEKLDQKVLLGNFQAFFLFSTMWTHVSYGKLVTCKTLNYYVVSFVKQQ